MGHGPECSFVERQGEVSRAWEESQSAAGQYDGALLLAELLVCYLADAVVGTCHVHLVTAQQFRVVYPSRSVGCCDTYVVYENIGRTELLLHLGKCLRQSFRSLGIGHEGIRFNTFGGELLFILF